MKREFLEKLGLEKEAIDKIMDENGKDVESAKTKATELEGELTKSKEMLAERDKQIDTLSKSKGNAEELQAEIEKLKLANKEADDKHQQEVKDIKINSAIQAALSGAKAKNLRSVEVHIDKSKLQLQEDGSVAGLAEQVKRLQENEETKFLFNVQLKGYKPGESGNRQQEKATPSSLAEAVQMHFKNNE